ncbi:hypothetical protein BUALT_Bualt07G0174800 [Buddleja alternifolia]|uniref:Uncharacterized protein n=1 Tax=Buddleja alternifolia TaxID=168488 RepID=A0AAV6XAY5_9LAMI|nr:hypothetical protein BUALT_Bualt07G0174800 [Buddleja alternifolia]
MIPSYRLWLLISAVALTLLLLWSQLSDINKISGKKYEHFIPKRTLSKGPNAPPVLAYWILGSKGENKRIMRLVKAIYHPRNQYLLQLDSSSPDHERVELAILVHSHKILGEFGNVDVVGKSYGVNQMGASGLAAVLHAAALLMRISADWDWFIPLSTSDYPLSTQDDILYAFTSLPRDLNFVGYTNDTDKRQNASLIAVDPSLYLTEKAPVFYAAEARQKPDSFQLFQGSAWMILSRVFVEHCVNGIDNLPRKLLMYFNNVNFPLQSYFQTILCNTPQFQNATINNNLRYIINEDHNMSHYGQLMESQAIFATPFRENDRKLQEIDEKILNRSPDQIVPGKWCTKTGLMNESSSSLNISDDLCSYWGDIDDVEAGARGIKLGNYLSRMVAEKKSVTRLCRGHIMQKERKK